MAYPFAQVGIPPLLPRIALDTAGYWLVTSDGTIYTFGNAPFEGEDGFFGTVVAMATTPTGNGYYMFLQGGPVAHYGDAVALPYATNAGAPIVFGQSTSTGKGYWEFAANGGVFSFGDAPFEGSLGGVHLNAPITAAIAFGSDVGPSFHAPRWPDWHSDSDPGASQSGAPTYPPEIRVTGTQCCPTRENNFV